MYGLDTDTIRSIKEVLKKQPQINKVVLYGSRAKGNYRNGSDIDITLFGKNLTLNNSVHPLMDGLEELYLPYTFDISIFSHIDNEDLIEHINRVGQVLYLKEKGLPKGDALSLPKGWEEKKLIDIAEVSTGKWNANHANKTGKYRFYTCAYKHGMCGTKRFSGKTLILPGNGVNVGEVFYYEGEFDAYQRTYVIFNINISSKYLHYHMCLFWKELGTKLQYGSATNFIKIGNFQNYSVEYPPLPEQKRIVAILDQAFAAIETAKANTEKNLKNARELFQSKLQETFANGKLKIENGEWEEKTLNEVTTILGDGLHGTPKYDDNGKYYFINGNNLEDGKIVFKEKTKRVSFEEYEKYKKNLNERTVLVSINGTLGNIAFYNKEKIILGKSACYFNLSNSIDKNFVKYVVLSPQFKEYMNTVYTGATIKNVSLKSMRNYKINFPRLDEQKRIAKKLDSVSTEVKKLATIYQQKTNDLEELKQSVLQKAFSGQLNNIN